MAKEVIEQFYSAFQAMDAERMASCYHNEVVFEDPAFGKLRGVHAGNMWRMLIDSQKGKDFRIEFSDITTDGNQVTVHWEAWYTFSKTGRKIHNSIDATFEFQDGKIIRHRDDFDLYKWAKQALGIQGVMIGWTSFFRKKLQSQTHHLLRKYEQKLAES